MFYLYLLLLIPEHFGHVEYWVNLYNHNLQNCDQDTGGKKNDCDGKLTTSNGSVIHSLSHVGINVKGDLAKGCIWYKPGDKFDPEECGNYDKAQPLCQAYCPDIDPSKKNKLRTNNKKNLSFYVLIKI